MSFPAPPQIRARRDPDNAFVEADVIVAAIDETSSS